MEGQNQSSTEILVTWGKVPESQRHGDITHYIVIYQKTEGGQEKRKKVYAPKQSVVLTALTKFTEYSIKVSASTIKGEGPASDPKVVSTDQDSKLRLINNFYLSTTIYEVMYQTRRRAGVSFYFQTSRSAPSSF